MPDQDQARIQGWRWGCSDFCTGGAGETQWEQRGELSYPGTFDTGCTKPHQQNQGCFISGLCWAESGISLSGEGAENDTVGKSLLGNLIQEQHKCGICLWPVTVRTAQGSKAGSQNFSPLHLFPSTHQRLLKACVTQDCVKRSILGSAFHWGLPLPPGHEVKKRATKTQK